MEYLPYLFATDGFVPSYFRPLLAATVQAEDIKELCKLLVVVSREAAKAYVGTAVVFTLI
jgi:hypothetical protein